MKNSNSFIIKKISPQIEKTISDEGLELFDITLRSERGGKVLRILIDSEKGAGIDDCSKISRAVSQWLDSDENLIPFDRYSLEVSTPGLERPLRNEKDFVRFAGKKCKIVTKEKDESGRKNYTGVIETAEDGIVRLYVEKESTSFDIAADNIAKANLVVEFDCER